MSREEQIDLELKQLVRSAFNRRLREDCRVTEDEEIKVITRTIIHVGVEGHARGFAEGRAEGLHEAARIVLASTEPRKYRLRREVASAIAEQIVAAIKRPVSADTTV